MLEQRITTPEQQKWLTKLTGFDYEIVYMPGRMNNIVDALSRREQMESKTKDAMVDLTAISQPVWAI